MSAAPPQAILFLSPHVRDLASSVYTEFSDLVSRFGEGVIDGIAPIIIRTLERVDRLHEEKEIAEANIAALQSANLELLTRRQFDAEIKNKLEERVMLLDDQNAETKAVLEKKVLELSSLVRIQETKFNASNDHALRLEEKVVELRKELSNAQSRYSELLSSHVAHIERSKRKGTPVISAFFPTPHFPSDIHQSAESAHKTESSTVFPNQKDRKAQIEFDGQFLTTLCLSDEDTSDYERQFCGQFPIEQNDETEDMVSNVSGTSDLLAEESIETEVKKLIAENQDLAETKNALNILKDDLLCRIDDLMGENIVLRNELEIFNEDMAALEKRASRKQRLLVGHLQRLILSDHCNRLPVRDRRALSQPLLSLTSSIVHLAAHPPPPPPINRHSRPNSCPARFLLRLKKTRKPPIAVKPNSERQYSSNIEDVNKPVMTYTRREMARAIVERKYYKERYLEMKDQLSHKSIQQRSLKSRRTGVLQQHQPVTRSPQRTSVLKNLANQVLDSVQSLASDFVQGFEDIVNDDEVAASREAVENSFRSQTANALWNLFGNFVGQAVSYTAEAVIGTGSDLPTDVSRKAIAATVKSKVSLRSPSAPGIFDEN